MSNEDRQPTNESKVIFFFLLFNNILLFLKGEISWQDVICFVVQPKLTKMFLALGDVSYSSNLLQQPGNYKNSTNENPRQKGMTDVNRKNEGRQKNKHTVKKSYVWVFCSYIRELYFSLF